MLALQAFLLIRCFNTQPPEGGWIAAMSIWYCLNWFQHTAARRRLGRQAKQRRY